MGDEEDLMNRSQKTILAALMGSAAILGGANVAVHSSKASESTTTTQRTDFAQRAEIARNLLRSKNYQYNCYILGCSDRADRIYALDDPRGISAERAKGIVHDDLIEGCEGDETDPFCDIVRHYQDLRVHSGSSLGSRDRG